MSQCLVVFPCLSLEVLVIKVFFTIDYSLFISQHSLCHSLISSLHSAVPRHHCSQLFIVSLVKSVYIFPVCVSMSVIVCVWICC